MNLGQAVFVPRGRLYLNISAADCFVRTAIENTLWDINWEGTPPRFYRSVIYNEYRLRFPYRARIELVS